MPKSWRLTQYQTKRKECLESCDKLLDLAAKENRDLTPEETEKLTAHKGEFAKWDAKAKDEAEFLTMAGASDAILIPEDGPLDTGGPVSAKGTKVGNVKPGFADDPKCGFSSPREFLLSVMEASNRGLSDDRLKYLATAGGDEQGGYSDPYGGFLVPTGFSPNFLTLRPEDDPIGARTTKVPMSTKKLEIPARVDKDHSSSVCGGLTVTRRAETQTQSAARMEMEKVALEAYSLFGLAYATEEILTDSPISFAALLEQGFSDQFTYHLIDERINGTGVGEMEGIMNAPCLVSVSKDTNQTATTITGTNVINMRARCWRYQDAIWLANHDCLPQLAKVCLTVGTNEYPIALYQQSLKEDVPDMLCGRPIYYTEYTKTLGTKGDLILGNWGEYLEGTLQPLQSAESIHVRFVNHERTFKFWLRNGGRVWWRSELTPKNSSNTLSPFVVLNTRS